MATLDDAIYAQITDLCEKGDGLSEVGQYEEAIVLYKHALSKLPEPYDQWEASTWIVTAIGDVYFLNRKYTSAFLQFSECMKLPGAIGNPFIHLRLGQSAFETSYREIAIENLLRAYLIEGEEIFEGADPKYLEFALKNLGQSNNKPN